ncbi:MAG: DUF669 domain-containing protein [Kiritimatiellae bacterium]|nr:DUF669 domain-containing protein [Kiritimatiellia bacterium]
MAEINFDATAITPTRDFDALPPGTYEAVITDSEAKAMKSGNGMGFNFTFEVVSGECKGRKVFAWLTYEHRTSPDAQRIGREQLSAMCRAAGIERLTDTAQLHNIPLLVTVAVDRNDATRNIVKKVAPRKAAAPAPQASSQETAPWAR